jgi:hypothetical protein
MLNPYHMQQVFYLLNFFLGSVLKGISVPSLNQRKWFSLISCLAERTFVIFPSISNGCQMRIYTPFISVSSIFATKECRSDGCNKSGLIGFSLSMLRSTNCYFLREYLQDCLVQPFL